MCVWVYKKVEESMGGNDIVDSPHKVANHKARHGGRTSVGSSFSSLFLGLPLVGCGWLEVRVTERGLIKK